MNIFALKTKLRGLVVNLLKLNRPTSYPFITGDGYRAISQHVLDEISGFDPNQVETNDIVFIRNDFLKDFFLHKHPLINNKYILISSNDDTNVSQDYEKFIDDKIIHWFTSALLFKNKKISAIPIGITNYHFNYSGRGNLSYLYENINKTKIRKNKMSFGFSTAPTALERIGLKKMLRNNNFADNIDTKKQSDYYRKMSGYKFTICPDGRAIDSHRTWEALYLNVVPILKRSILAENFKNLGMPLLIVENWNELDNFNEEFLSKKYDELKSNFDNPTIYMNFWINLIISKRIG